MSATNDIEKHSSFPALLSRPRSERVLSLLVLVLLVSAWEIWVRVGGVPRFLLPPPSEVVQTLLFRFQSGFYWPHIAATVTEILSGFTIAAILGIILGAAISASPLVERLIYPYLVALQTLPKIAIAPLIIIWFGFGLSSKVVIASMVAFFPVLVNVIAGLQSVDAKRLALMKSLGASPWQIFWKLKWPGSLPFVFAGLEIAIIFAVLGAIIGEFVGANTGLGSVIIQDQFRMNVAGVFGSLILLSTIGITLHICIGLVKRKVLFWSTASEARVAGV